MYFQEPGCRGGDFRMCMYVAKGACSLCHSPLYYLYTMHSGATDVTNKLRRSTCREITDRQDQPNQANDKGCKA